MSNVIGGHAEENRPRATELQPLEASLGEQHSAGLIWDTSLVDGSFHMSKRWTMADRYTSFTDLAANERLDIDYQIRVLERGSDTVILAPHGGWIEPDTSKIAEAIAGSVFSFYAFESLRNAPHGHFHITSHRFDEPNAVAILGRSWTAIAVHGRRDEGTDAVWLGGRAIDLRDAVGNSLRSAGFETELNKRLPGTEATNICNRTRSGEGVQLELSRRLRRQLVCDANLLRSFANAVQDSVPPPPVN